MDTANPDQPTPPVPATPADELASLAAAERAALDRVTLATELGGVVDAQPVARTTMLDVDVGHTRSFQVHSFVTNTNRATEATLQYAGPVLLVYVENGVPFDAEALASAAQQFEQELYPRMHDLFGLEWTPGVDGDPRIVVLNVGDLDGGVLGYFSPRDSVPQTVNPFSNEHDMLYMDIGANPPGDDRYLNTLVHEFQHMIHWNEQRAANSWFNEGTSTLAEDLTGLGNNLYVGTYLTAPDVQLNNWNSTPGSSLGHYGASQLFMRYIYARYAGDDELTTLIRANAGRNLAAFTELAARTDPAITSFALLFGDWATANLLNTPDLDGGRYSYRAANGVSLLPRPVVPRPLAVGEHTESVRQFGVDYYTLPAASTVTFSGQDTVSLVGADVPDGHAWWSGRDDNSTATLTGSLDLRQVAGDRATLQFDLWYDLEPDYDYAFVSVSADGGATWETLPATTTTTEDPHGANYGHGWTGKSGAATVPAQSDGAADDAADEPAAQAQWIPETVDLSPYVGSQVLVRFWQVNDESYNSPGMLLDNVRLAENDTPLLAQPDTVGFVAVDGILPQQWEVRLVRVAADGTTTVERLTPDGAARASTQLAPDEQSTLIVAATTLHTTEPAPYTITIQQ